MRTVGVSLDALAPERRRELLMRAHKQRRRPNANTATRFARSVRETPVHKVPATAFFFRVCASFPAGIPSSNQSLRQSWLLLTKEQTFYLTEYAVSPTSRCEKW